ncbi:MAG: ATP-dependent DNA helicase [Alphaproteobacteria bacterium]
MNDSAALGKRLLLPEAPVLVAGVRGAKWLESTGEVEDTTLQAAAARASAGPPPILCHAPATARRLKVDRFPAHDLLELFAFVRPAAFCLPTPRGLAAALGLRLPRGLEAAALALYPAMGRLRTELGEPDLVADAAAVPLARARARGGWLWGPSVLAALGADADEPGGGGVGGLAVWEALPEWAERAPEPPPGNVPVEPAEARARLAGLLGAGSEARPQQADYASAVTPAFAPREGAPRVVLAEAGTGVGKTLGYIAPASVWAQKNQGTVWISTFTRNLQHQIDGELDRLYPESDAKPRKVVIRKGRENYLCLLNMEEAARAAGLLSRDAVALGLLARWARRTRDGDMIGGDFPAWLVDLVGRGRTLNLADRRGECVYSACSHYHKCFIERSVRRARRAEIVVANHALVMAQAALGGIDDTHLPARYVFDEGHHVFDAADGAFSSHLSGQETADLRRWLRGAEGRRLSRARGLKRRVGDLIAGDGRAERALDAALKGAHLLPGEGWRQRLSAGTPVGPTEAFLTLVRSQVYGRAHQPDNLYSLECETVPPVEGLIEAAADLKAALARLAHPLKVLAARLASRLDDEAAELNSATRRRIEAIGRRLWRRGEVQLGGWGAMLEALAADTPPEFVDWFAVERLDGRDLDVGMHRHWVDPTIPFARAVAGPAHGLLITSATLTDGSGEVEADWAVAEARTGAVHLPVPAVRASVPSPFDYGGQTRVMVVTDVAKGDLAQLSAAYRELFVAAGGGGLGLFTAIARLRATYDRIAGPLDEEGITLMAQHVDGLDTSTLIDIFRAEPDTCLLGTDAVRDGIDVPGRSLRLIVFDRVPWPRPDILHRARKAAFGGRSYDDMIARLRLRQAYGRLVRRADDAGVFILLDPMMPSRLAGAFPEGVKMHRVGLAEAVRRTGAFLRDHGTG